MEEQLRNNVEKVEDILFELRIDADDEATLIHYVSRWADRKDLRTESGQSYFDAFLARLKEDKWYRDYGLWEGDSHPYLDLLYNEVEERAGELNTLVAQNSFEFGGYRPAWSVFKVTGEPTAERSPFNVNEELVSRTANLVLDGLAGWTSEEDSKIIGDALVGLPPMEQAAVLKNIMSRYDEADWTGIFGRYGEAWDVGMLYYLFEDLEGTDRTRVANALKASGVMAPDTVDTLVAGRGFVAKYLPYTTRKGEEAAQYWADLAVESEGVESGAAAFMGGLASLWTPETAGATILTLAGARVFPALGELHPVIGGTLAVGGTGLVSYTTTMAIQELITGENAWTGEQLNSEEKLARILMAGSGVLLMGATALSVTAAVPGQGAPPSVRITGSRVMTSEEVVGFKASNVRIPIEDLPPGQELWVPRGSVAARTANQAGLVDETALVPVSEAITLAPGESAVGNGMLPATRAPIGEWMPLKPSRVVPAAPEPLPLPPMEEPLALPPHEENFGSALSNQSLHTIESLYGLAARNGTAVARTYAELRTIADGLGGLRQQYLGTVGELLSADAAAFEGKLAVRAHGASNEPGPDVPTVTSRGVAEIVLKEAKLGSSATPYRIGESGLPVLYRDPVGLYEYIWGIVRNPQLPAVVRARFKLALDEGNIRWQLDTHGNVRIKLSGTDQFPGDIEINTPVKLPLE
jgi:hypothetical protein